MILGVGIALGIFLFFFLVLIHEFGHFLAAKKSGVKVLEFGIGIPPKVMTFYTDKSGTQYTINALPLGGFVRLKGEDPEDPDEFNARDSLIKAKIHKKIFIILGGVAMNLLAAWLIFTTVFFIGTQPVSIIPDENTIASEAKSYLMPSYSFLKEQGLVNPELENIPVTIDMIQKNSMAEGMGLLTGDLILAINDKEINPRNINNIIKNLESTENMLTYQRGDEVTSVDMICESDTCFLGIAYDKIGVLEIEDIKFPIGKAMLAALQEIKAETKITLNALGKLGQDLFSFDSVRIKQSVNGLTGPVGAVKFGQLILEYGGWIVFLAFAGMISLALAIFNILPIPALDGGRLLGMLIQRGFRLKAEKYFKTEGYINIVFFVLLLILGVYIMMKDFVFAWGWNIPFIG